MFYELWIYRIVLKIFFKKLFFWRYVDVLYMLRNYLFKLRHSRTSIQMHFYYFQNFSPQKKKYSFNWVWKNHGNMPVVFSFLSIFSFHWFIPIIHFHSPGENFQFTFFELTMWNKLFLSNIWSEKNFGIKIIRLWIISRRL